MAPKTICKGILIFHRYSKQVPFRKFDRYLFAATSIFLAAKLDNYPRFLDSCCKPYLFIRMNRKKLKLSEPLTNEKAAMDRKAIHEFQPQDIQMEIKREEFCYAEL